MMTAVQPVDQPLAATNGQTNPAYAYNAQCMTLISYHHILHS